LNDRMLGLIKTVFTIVGALFLLNWALARFDPEWDAKTWADTYLPIETVKEKLGIGSQDPDDSTDGDNSDEMGNTARNPLRGGQYHMSDVAYPSSKFNRVLQKVRESPGAALLNAEEFRSQLRAGKTYPVIVDNDKNRCGNCRGFKKVLRGTQAPDVNQPRQRRSARSSPG